MKKKCLHVYYFLRCNVYFVFVSLLVKLKKRIPRKSRSKEEITLHNRLGTCESYNKVKQRRNIMKNYTIKRSEEHGVPLPSHFSDNGWLTAAVDNKDWNDNSSLSGTEGRHQAVMTLYQDTTEPTATKLKLSEMGIEKTTKPSTDILPCQTVPPHEKPHKRPSLPEDFDLTEHYSDLIITHESEKAAETAEQIEFDKLI